MARRVLIADDNETIRRLVQSQVEELAGVEVCATVANGLEAVQAAIALRPEVLILDILMPELNGIQAAGVLKKSLPGAKVILFTILSDAVTPQMTAALGARIVSKTEGLRALGRTVQDLLEARAREVDEGLTRAINDGVIDSVQLDLLTQRFSAPLTRCGRDLKYLWVNEYYANFLNRPIEKIVGHYILDVVGKTAFDLLHGYFDQVLRGENVLYKIEVDYESAGRRYIAASYKPTFDNSRSPDGWLACIDDITAHASESQSPLANLA